MRGELLKSVYHYEPGNTVEIIDESGFYTDSGIMIIYQISTSVGDIWVDSSYIKLL